VRRTLAIMVLVAVLGSGCSPPRVLDGKGLSQQAETLQSSAAEGALLAHDLVAGRTLAVYAREHAADLDTAVSQSMATLEAANTEPLLESPLRQLTELARRINADLQLLGTASPEEGMSLFRRLQSEAQAGEKIATGLS
jgi:hypothetical protein